MIGKKEKTLRQHASDTRGITFEAVRIPEKYRLGQEGDGFKIAMSAFDHTGAVGVARRAMHEATEYSKNRRTFGQPIHHYQAISFMIADMAKDIEAPKSSLDD